MLFSFSKYQGTGNDFIIIDNREKQFAKSTSAIEQICNRKFGIGADGLILLENTDDFDFRMVYYNADGRESSMCGNGGRCITAFANKIGLISDTCRFIAIDGPHEAKVHTQSDWVDLKMMEVSGIEEGEDYFLMDTGSPHYVIFVEDVSDINVVETGQMIRYSERFRESGVNVNFVEKQIPGILVATYERGVEDETLSCGTGVTAAAISYYLKHPQKASQWMKSGGIPIETKGGQLKVRYQKSQVGFQEVWLCGPATLVFEGSIELPN